MGFPSKPGSGGASADISKTLLKNDNLASIADKAAARLNISATPQGDFDGVEGFSALRARAPRYEGERVRLRYHTKKATTSGFSNTVRGGGWFIGRLSSRADDGGFTASAGGNYYWERDIEDIATLTVDHFGAVGDGVTDDSAAFMAMYKFLQGTLASSLSGDNAKRQGLVITAQNYALSDMDFTTAAANGSTTTTNYAEFAIRSAVPVHFGVHAAATITPLSTSTNPLIKTNHRRVTLHGFKFVDSANKAFFVANRDTSTFRLSGCTLQEPNATAPSKKPFFKNVCSGGQYINASCLLPTYTGGIFLDLLDTIGARFHEINPSMCAERIIETGWSGQEAGVWDHPTDFELSRCNFQNQMSQPFRFSRVAQGLINNVWIEHSAAAGDFNNSQFVINGLSIEDCKTQALGWKGRFVIFQNSTPTSNYIDMDTGPYLSDGTNNPAWTSYYTNGDGTLVTQWQSNYEMGYARLEAAYSLLKNATTINYLTGALHGNNVDGTQRWLKVGTFETRTLGSEWHLEVEGTAGYNALRTGTAATYVTNNAPAKCCIDIQRPADSGTDTPAAYKSIIAYKGAQSAVVDTNIITLSSTLIEVWVKLAAFCGGYSVHVTGTGPTRKEQGLSDRFVPGDGVLTTTAPAAVAPAVLSVPVEMGWWGGKTIGYGFVNGMLAENVLALTTAEAALMYTKEPSFFQWKMVNGYKQAVPLAYAYIPVFTTQPTAKTVATGAALSLTAAATEAYGWQWYKDGVALSGATAATYTKASATAADAGNYYVIAVGRPTANTKQSNTVAVTVS